MANKSQVYYPNEEDKEKGIDFAKWPPQFDVVVSFIQEIKKKNVNDRSVSEKNCAFYPEYGLRPYLRAQFE